MAQGSPLGTLAALEARLEEAIAAAGKLPPELVETTEHARQKERRQVSAGKFFLVLDGRAALRSEAVMRENLRVLGSGRDGHRIERKKKWSSLFTRSFELSPTPGPAQVARQAKLAEERREADERSRRALARAAAPAFHRAGKPDMFRSVLGPRCGPL